MHSGPPELVKSKGVSGKSAPKAGVLSCIFKEFSGQEVILCKDKSVSKCIGV